jgi:hypothetical protein
MNFTDGRPPIDNAIKLLTFKNHKHVAALVCGDAIIGGRHARPPDAPLPELEATLPLERMTILQYVQKLCNFFMRRFEEQNVTEGRFSSTTFLIAGFDKKERVGRAYSVVIPYDYHNPDYSPQVKELLKGEDKFGVECCGQREIIKRLYKGHPSYYERVTQDRVTRTALQTEFSPEQTEQILQILKENELHEGTKLWRSFDDLSLREAVELAYFFMWTTIKAQKFMKVDVVCGGAIRGCTITRDGGLKMLGLKNDDFPK